MIGFRKFLIFFLLLSHSWSFSQTTGQKDMATIKAQAIYNFVNHIEWPNFDKLKEFRIGLLGADKDLIKALNFIAANSMVMRLPIKIIPLLEHSDIKYIPQTEILYVNAANFKNFDISKIKKNVLVISYNEPDIYRSMISFMVIDNKLNFVRFCHRRYCRSIERNELNLLFVGYILGAIFCFESIGLIHRD